MGMETKKKSEANEYLNKLLNCGVKEGIDHTTPLQTPSYYNEELYKKAQKYYLKYLFLVFASHLSGLIAVLSIPTIFVVLIATKESETVAKAYRRYLRTVFHVVTWMFYPLKPGSPAWKSLDTVRKIHSRASKSCENSINAKINQKDLALTQFAFVGFFALNAEEYLCEEDKMDFYDAWIHFWRVNGYILGIKEEYNLCTDSWESSRERFIAVKEQVYKPALENVGEGFDNLARNLTDGLWFFSPTLTADSALFVTKWLAGCDRYQYFESDFKNGASKENTKLAYKELSLYQRFVVASTFFVSIVLYKYTLLRWYFNFRILLCVLLSYYLPVLAALKFGIKWAYVRIFEKQTDENAHVD